MDGLLKDHVAIVTGAARVSGISRAAAAIFIEHGAKVAILDLAADNPKDVAAELGENAMGVVCDVSSAEACRAAAAAVADRWGRIDVVVNSAGLTQRRKVAEITEADFDLVTDVVLRGTLLMTQAAPPHMPRHAGGAIVNVFSLSALQGGGIFGGPHYCAAKAGVLCLTRAMAKEFGPDGIRANAIAPGLIMTDFSRRGPLGRSRQDRSGEILSTRQAGDAAGHRQRRALPRLRPLLPRHRGEAQRERRIVHRPSHLARSGRGGANRHQRLVSRGPKADLPPRTVRRASMSRIFGPIRQLGHVVRDIEAAMAHWTGTLGIGPFHYFPAVPMKDIRYRGSPTGVELGIALANDGEMQIELIQQCNDAPSHDLDHLARFGGVPHHTSAWTEDFDGDMARILAAGARPAQTARIGSARLAYFDTAGAYPSTTMEIYEISGRPAELNERVHASARGWDGTNPIIRYG